MRWLLALFCVTAFAQETTLTTPTTIGPLQVKTDTESLLGITSWAQGGRLPAQAVMFEVPQVEGPPKKLYITPYSAGLGIEYDGLIEFWTRKLSIHNNFRSDSVPQPPQLWVGNPLDSGGISMQGMQDFTVSGGVPTVHNQWSEIVSETFLSGSHGDIRYIVRGTSDKHEFRGGPKNAEVIYATIGPDGLVVNGVNYTTLIASLKSRIDALEQGGGPVNPPPLE